MPSRACSAWVLPAPKRRKCDSLKHCHSGAATSNTPGALARQSFYKKSQVLNMAMYSQNVTSRTVLFLPRSCYYERPVTFSWCGRDRVKYAVSFGITVVGGEATFRIIKPYIYDRTTQNEVPPTMCGGEFLILVAVFFC